MADGWALVSGRTGFVNLHAMGGLGNAMGVLVASKASETPLVVTAGQQDTRHLMTEPWLSGDLVALAAPVTKWAKEVRRGEDVGQALRRAFAIARTAAFRAGVPVPADGRSRPGGERSDRRQPPRRRASALRPMLLASPSGSRTRSRQGDRPARRRSAGLGQPGARAPSSRRAALRCGARSSLRAPPFLRPIPAGRV